MEQVKEWHESDFFWEEFENQLFDSQRWRDVAKEVCQIESLLGIEQGAKILDLCCGPGRHLLALALQGYKLTGVDRTKRYLEQVSRRASQENLKIEVVHSDMRDFCTPSSFDAVINMANSFGYFADQDDDRKVLGNIFRSLKSGGVFLMDIIGKEVLARIFNDKWYLRENGSKLIVYERICNDWTWREMTWVLRKKNHDEYKYVSGHRIYCAAEIKHELASAGFININVYGDFYLSPYDSNARQMVVVARKPGH